MSPRILMALRPQDPIPDWITHIVHLGPSLRIASQGDRGNISENTTRNESRRNDTRRKQTAFREDRLAQDESEALVEMRGVQVSYGSKTILGNWSESDGAETRSGLWWTVKRGQRWGVFGPNGKFPLLIPHTTIPADHNQAQAKRR